MSRIGKRNIKIPQGVKVTLNDGIINVEGAKGKLTQKLSPFVNMKIEGDEISFTRQDNEPSSRAAHGTMRSLMDNMVHGVSQGYIRELEINGVGYKAELKGDTVHLHVGFSGPKPYKLPAGIKIDIERGVKVKISGIDKQLVGKVASEIRKIRPPEPYKSKGIKFAEEIIKKKVGKAAVTAAS